ncbi:MAG TPA: hypothetical protein VM260_23285 [Pirellula sp.]|nr:hypothetical protein [Pirellula sp.]
MHRHLIAGAFACLGSSLFGQTTNPANQVQGTLNNVQNTLQNGIQKAQDAVNRNVPQSSGSYNSSEGQNRSLLNGQNQVNGGIGSTGDAGIQSNTNLQNRLDRQPGQLNSNFSTQAQGQSTFSGQQRNGVLQDSTNQYGNAYQANGNSGFQSPAVQRQGQPMQSGQLSNQQNNGSMPYNGAMQYNGSVQNNGSMQNNGSGQNMPMTPTWNSSQNNSMQQSWSSQNAGVHLLRFDASGREFICIGGRPVYFDNVNSVSSQGNSGTQNQHRSGYGNYNLKNGQNTQNQSRQGDQLKNEQQTPATDQKSFSDSTNSRTVDPSNSLKATNSPEVESPARDRLRSDKQNDSTRRQNDGETRSDFDAKSDVNNPSKTSNDVTEPRS